MSKRLLCLMFTMVVGVLLHACSSRVPASTVIAGSEVQGWLEAVEDLPHRSGNRSCSVALGGCVEDEDGFDPNEYFTVFEHLSMEPGYTLDSILLSDSVGSRPVVYARRLEDRPFSSYAEFASAQGAELQASFETIAGSDAYLLHVRSDGSPEGYLQLVLLSNVEDQYDLDWHGLYNDTTVVTSEAQAVALVTQAEAIHEFEPGDPLAGRLDSLKRRLAKLDYTPSVSLEEGQAAVRLINFTKWGGFHELQVILQTEFPHLVLRWRERTRVAYDWGVMY